jgi:hypothetical protein
VEGTWVVRKLRSSAAVLGSGAAACRRRSARPMMSSMLVYPICASELRTCEQERGVD